MPDAEEVEGPTGPLSVVVATPPTRQSEARCLLVCHGLPLTRGGGRTAAGTLPELADHLAAESGWIVASCSLSGVGTNPGTFSGPRWRDDLAAVVEHLSARAIRGCGSEGSASAACSRSTSPATTSGCAASRRSPPPSTSPAWAGTARALPRRGRGVGRGRPRRCPSTTPRPWRRASTRSTRSRRSRSIPPRRLLVVHGATTSSCPWRRRGELVAAAGGPAELRIIQGAGHWLRSDPRMVATLIGWLDRIR